MKILITGATGLVGTELVSFLLKKGVEVHYLTTSKNKIENRPHCQGFYWDPKQGIIDIHCLQGVDAIIHLAGANIAHRWTKEYKKEMIESRIQGANLLFRTLKENPNQVKQIVSASGTAVYPDSTSKIYGETDGTNRTGFLANLVVQWEQSADQFTLLPVKVCKLRTGIVLASNGGALQEMIKPIRLGLGATFGNGKQMTSWIHIHDLVSMYYFAIANAWEGVYNAVSPFPVSNKELISKLAKRLHKPLWLPGIPKAFMKLLLGEMHQVLFEDKRISADKAAAAGFQFKYPTIELALRDIMK